MAFAELPSLSESILGNVYNVTDAFTTTANFVEGAGNKYPKGTNVVVVKVGDAYKYDVLAGFVDLSGYVEKEAGKGLSDVNSLRLSRISWMALRLAQTSMSIPPTPLLQAACTRPPWMKRAM